MRITEFFKFAIIAVLLGRGYEHLFFHGPYRSLLWDEDLLRPLFEMVGISWKSWVLNPNIDLTISVMTKLFGAILILSAVLIYRNFTNLTNFFLKASGSILVFMSFCKFKEMHYEWPMLIEHAIQF